MIAMLSTSPVKTPKKAEPEAEPAPMAMAMAKLEGHDRVGGPPANIRPAVEAMVLSCAKEGGICNS